MEEKVGTKFYVAPYLCVLCNFLCTLLISFLEYIFTEVCSGLPIRITLMPHMMSLPGKMGLERVAHLGLNVKFPEVIPKLTEQNISFEMKDIKMLFFDLFHSLTPPKHVHVKDLSAPCSGCDIEGKTCRKTCSCN